MNELKNQLPESVPPLNSYYVYMTGGCNLACKHCWIAPTFQPNGATGGHLDYELLKMAINEGIPLGLRHVKLTGGEPLLHPDFIRIVDLLKKKQLGLTIETNGVLMEESLVQHLKQSGALHHISISLDGAIPETHDPFRGVKGCFEKTCKAIRLLAETGFRPQVIMSIHKDNVSEMEALVNLSIRLGASSVKFNLVQPSGRGDAMASRGDTLDIYRLVDLGKWVETSLQKTASIPLFFSWPSAFFSLKRLMSDSGQSCQLKNILGILHSGHLAMCGIGMEVPELCYGKLGEDNVQKIWISNPILKQVREKLPWELEGICHECIFRNHCQGFCVAENYLATKKLTSPYWFCQQAREAGLFPTSRTYAI